MTVTWISRQAEQPIRELLKQFPAVAILGPRQCGKTSLAKRLVAESDTVISLDLESPTDLATIRGDPEAFLRMHQDKLICFDEIQRFPELFPVLRPAIDAQRRPGRFLLLGSASPDILRNASESLAGRIAYHDLTPFQLPEVATGNDEAVLRRLWLRGGFPDSYLATSDAASFRWRTQFIRTFMERDLAQFGVRIPTPELHRLWQLFAHSHGQLSNISKIAATTGLATATVNNHLSLLEQAFVLRRLPPFAVNLKKRLVKSPRFYWRDSGILHQILGMDTQAVLLGHPLFGASWEGVVIEHVLSRLVPGVIAGYYRTSNGAELDLVLEYQNRRVAIECKASSAPAVTSGFGSACAELNIGHAFVAAPVARPFPLAKDAECLPLPNLLIRLKSLRFVE